LGRAHLIHFWVIHQNSLFPQRSPGTARTMQSWPFELVNKSRFRVPCEACLFASLLIGQSIMNVGLSIHENPFKYLSHSLGYHAELVRRFPLQLNAPLLPSFRRVQGYLAHKNPPPVGPYSSPMVILGGWVFLVNEVLLYHAKLASRFPLQLHAPLPPPLGPDLIIPSNIPWCMCCTRISLLLSRSLSPSLSVPLTASRTPTP